MRSRVKPDRWIPRCPDASCRIEPRKKGNGKAQRGRKPPFALPSFPRADDVKIYTNRKAPMTLRKIKATARWGYLVPLVAVLSCRYRIEARRRPHSFAKLIGSLPSTRSVTRNRPGRHTLIRVVDAATSIPPFRTSCLFRALVLADLFDRFGYPSTIVLGISESGAFGRPEFAHAWIESEKRSSAPGYRELLRVPR